MRNPEPLAALCEIADREAGDVRLWLPFPPNTNNLFANGSRGRFPTPRYKAWTVAATEALSRQRVRRVKGRYRLVLIFDRPDRRLYQQTYRGRSHG